MHRALAQRYTVYAPSHAGYDKSDRGFVSNITDLAHYYLGLMRSQRLDRVVSHRHLHGRLGSR